MKPEKITLRDHSLENKRFTQRAKIAFGIAALLLFFILCRLFYLQIIEHNRYITLSNKNRVMVVPIPPKRGLIYDRHGVLLAENIATYRLEIIPEQIKNIDATLTELNDIIPISDKEKERFYKALRFKRRFEGVPIKQQLNEEELARFAINRYRFPGVDITASLIRRYPQKDLFAHTIGYVGRISEDELKAINASNYSASHHIGKTGLEKYYETLLHGKVGLKHVEADARGRIVRVLNQTPPVPGNDLYLSLDSKLQQIAKHALKDKRGAIVAIIPKTGEVLVSLSSPSFDPNLFVVGIDQTSYDNLLYSPDKPLYNRTLRGQYPPGSTIKPILGLQALHKGLISANQKIYDPGWYQLRNDKHKYRNWKRSGHGWVDFQTAIRLSNTTYFYHLAVLLGIDNIYEVLTDFGFGRLTGIDNTGELAGLVPSIEWKRATHQKAWYPGETLITGIGQGYTLVTPMQLAHYTATLANAGHRKTPHFLTKSLDPLNNEIPFSVVQQPSASINDPYLWGLMQKSMQQVITHSTGTAFSAFKNAPYTVAAKTGTAQVSNIAQGKSYNAEALAERLRDHSLFIGYAPVENPEIAIAVLVENSSEKASNIARVLLDSFFEE